MENNGWLNLLDFAKRAGISKATVYIRLKRGIFSKIKKEAGPTGQKAIFIHESELPNVVSTKQAAVRATPTMIPDDEFKDIKLKEVKNIRFQRGKIPYKSLATAVALVHERQSWEAVTLKTGVNKLNVIRLINEINEAVEDDPEKWKDKGVMDYLWADRPYAVANKKMPRKGK